MLRVGMSDPYDSCGGDSVVCFSVAMFAIVLGENV
jgi:hypothetical protein